MVMYLLPRNGERGARLRLTRGQSAVIQASFKRRASDSAIAAARMPAPTSPQHIMTVRFSEIWECWLYFETESSPWRGILNVSLPFSMEAFSAIPLRPPVWPGKHQLL
jgi:hypothetical protein